MTALVGAQQPALHQAGDAMHAGHHDVGGIALLTHHRSLVLIATVAQGQVRLPAIGVDGAARLHGAVDEWQQAFLGDVGHVSEPDPPEPPGILDLYGDRNDRLGLGLASVGLVLDPANVGLVDLDVPGAGKRRTRQDDKTRV